jgi:EmrB/QacA subfamily drug resistance transporter
MMQDIDNSTRFRILFAAMTTLFLAALDQTIIAPALPAIAREFGSWHNLSWVVTAYLLVATAVIPIYGKASDVYGRRPVLMLAISIFCAGSVLCAMSGSVLELAISRGVQALGGGGLISLSMTVVGDLFAPRERGRYQGYISGIYASAAVLGPVLGGAISDHLPWSSIFWINIPVSGVALWIAFTSMRALRTEPQSRYLDFPGAAILASGICLIVYAASTGGPDQPWTSMQTVLPMLAGVALLVAFVVRVAKMEDALVSKRVAFDSVIALAVTASLLAVGTSVGLSTFAPTYFQMVLGLSPTQAGLALVPMMLGIAAGATLSGRTLTRIDNYKIVPLVGLGCSVTILIAVMLFLDDLPAVLLSLTLAGVTAGIGTIMPISLIVVQNAAGRSDMGAATALMNLGRQLGAVLIVTVFGAVLLGASYGRDAVAASAGLSAVQLRHDFGVVLAIAAINLSIALWLFWALEKRPLRSSS